MLVPAHLVKQSALWLLCGLVLVNGSCSKEVQSPTVILGLSTSFGNSGLFEVLQPAYEQLSGVRLRPHLVGSGVALQMLERGRVDVVISHAPEMEAKYIKAHPEWLYKKLMYNDFLLVGPLDDPANVMSAPRIEIAVQRIVERRARFVSRGDESGTHTHERQLFTLAGVTPSPEQVVVSGQGMSRTLRIASELEAYALTDAATFTAMNQVLSLQPVFQGGPNLLNTYSVISSTMNLHEASRADTRSLVSWLTDGGGRELIKNFRLSSDEAGFMVWPLGSPRDQPADLPF
ncbi:MAG TPA: tungsten ABC transporter substrate-binding protein [Gemmatimonadetes bacterium]|jgi:tungstate transport system substrate-binding protein|nr:tungsten ABC transporter substrate-binding protein [Gemmatimonadota bacterium]